MIKYKKAVPLVLIGILGEVLLRGLVHYVNPKVILVSSLIFFGIIVWGLLLVLKAKNRSRAWIFLLPLNFIGLIAIFLLADNRNLITWF